MEDWNNRWERFVDGVMEKLTGAKGWSWHHKNKIAMLYRYPRYMNRENIIHSMNKRRDIRRFLWVGGVAMGFVAGVFLGGLTTLSTTYTMEEAFKSPGMTETVITTYPPTKDIPHLPVAADKAPSVVLRSSVREVVAYNSTVSQTDGSPCISADGSNICEMWQSGKQVCAANFVPFGTELDIEGIGTCTVHDRMNSRYPQRVDVYMGYDVPAALQFGFRKLNVTIK